TGCLLPCPAAPGLRGRAGEVELGDAILAEDLLHGPRSPLRRHAARPQLGDESTAPARPAADAVAHESGGERLVVEPAAGPEVGQARIHGALRKRLAQEPAPQLLDGPRPVGEQIEGGLPDS